jgi:DNA-directed RNA polymerase subunit RPC12/RpoP
MSAKDFLIDCLRAPYSPRETRPIATWARENIVIDAGENRLMAGTPYDIKLTPYNETVFDFLQCPWTRELIIAKSSQIGLTLAVYVGMAWLIKHRPGPMLYCARDIQAVRELGKRRLVPVLRQIDKTTEGELDERDQTCVTKSVNGVILRLVGAQSAAGMVSWPASYVFGDEFETHPVLPEGTTGDLMRARCKGDPESKVLYFSKLQDEPKYETDKITKKPKITTADGTRCCDEYYSGTQEKYHVPCPHCDYRQELVWDQMKLDPSAIVSEPGKLPLEYDSHKVLESTYYECKACKGRIVDKHKHKMVPQGEWIPTPTEQRKGPYKTAYPYRRSVHISDLYCFLFSSVKWGNLMLKWIEAQGDDEKLGAFYNDHLGLPRPERKSAGRVELAAIDRLISDYPRLQCYDEGRRWQGAQVPLTFDPLFIGITIDKQDGYLKYVISAFMANGEPHILDYGVLANEDDITFLLQNFIVKSKSGDDYRIYCGLFDSGFRRSKVIEYCWEIRGLIPYFAPARGVQRVQSRASIWVTEDKSIPNAAVSIVNFDSQAWEDDLYRRRIIEFDPKKPKRRYPRIHLPLDVCDDFKSELSNATQVEETIKGRQLGTWIWQKAKHHESNDYADCVKMALLLWVLHAPDETPEDPPEQE